MKHSHNLILFPDSFRIGRCPALTKRGLSAKDVNITMAYNSFSAPKTEGDIVYGLTDNGKIFYVGVTDFLRQRYQSHFGEYLCRYYIHEMRMKEQYPGVVIFGIFDSRQEAEACEHAIIRCLSFMGNKLCNNHQNPHENHLKVIPVTMGVPKRMPPKLKDEILKTAFDNYNTYRAWQPRRTTS